MDKKDEAKTCKGCAHAHSIPLEQFMQCRGMPPQVVPVMQQTPMGPRSGFASLFPQVDAQTPACGLWVPKVVQITPASTLASVN